GGIGQTTQSHGCPGSRKCNILPYGGGMGATRESDGEATDIFTELLRAQGEAARQVLASCAPEAAQAIPSDAELKDWGESALRLQQLWLDFHRQQAIPEMPVPLFADPAQWMGLMQAWQAQVPWLDPRRQQELIEEGLALWEDILAQYGIGPKAAEDTTPDIELP